MRIVKTEQDANALHYARLIPVAFLNHVENYFYQLRNEQENGLEIPFCLSRHGYIVILEMGDNVRDLGNVGLGREVGGLLGSYPEYVELLDVAEGLQAYKIAVLYDDDYLMTFFTQAGAHDEEVEQWLKDKAERN
ncbi:hypothetical protein GQF01_11460 [Paenibacillus sp. 5J-6]|uniref:Uncharacterized protein n=1 Tax=Paenibacillus silvestris TaxID=2606219 RepID=A0A6L8UWV5_9BACL|nr:hypothetical protein [Paenibacillus silvestris]MZQ82718.1 hypothetical protein [Paenibacillus silvestris]